LLLGFPGPLFIVASIWFICQEPYGVYFLSKLLFSLALILSIIPK
jgi:hypothetical protein